MNLLNFNKTVPYKRQKGIKGYFQIIFHHFFDLVLLNFIFVVTSLPLFTVGASYKALIEVLCKYAEDENVYPVREYFQNFRKEFLKSTIYGLAFVVTSSIITFSCWFYLQLSKENIIFFLFAVVSAICLIIISLMICWFFPLFTKIEQDFKSLIINSFILAFKYFKSTILFLVVIVVLLSLIIALFPYSLPVVLILPFVLIGLSSGFICAERINEVFGFDKNEDN